MTRLLIVTAAALALTLTACGKIQTLERPAPLIGAGAKADYEASKKAAGEAVAAQKQEDSGPPEPLPPAAAHPGPPQ